MTKHLIRFGIALVLIAIAWWLGAYVVPGMVSDMLSGLPQAGLKEPRNIPTASPAPFLYGRISLLFAPVGLSAPS